jgi:hypothetical protein
MEQGQVLDRGQRLRCGHLVARGRRVFVRQNFGGEEVSVCWDCMCDKASSVLRPYDGPAVVNIDKAVFKFTPLSDPDDLDALIETGWRTVERNEEWARLGQFREWLGQWS